MTAKSSIIGIFHISRGTVNYSLVSSREVFMKALLCGAVAIILVHNHPSGAITPSRHDTELTEKIKDAGKLMDIPLMDHIIIGRNQFYSFKSSGVLE